jgi:hypothetical protein
MLLEDLQSGATVDRHLGDQLVLYAALADGVSEYVVPSVTEHLDANCWLAAQFLGAAVEVADRRIRSAESDTEKAGSAPGNEIVLNERGRRAVNGSNHYRPGQYDARPMAFEVGRSYPKHERASTVRRRRQSRWPGP